MKGTSINTIYLINSGSMNYVLQTHKVPQNHFTSSLAHIAERMQGKGIRGEMSLKV